MAHGDSSSRRSAAGRRQFATTHWSVVAAAGRAETTISQAALEVLCRTYWYPVYAYVRRLGHAPADAADLAQAFFARCLEKRWFANAERDLGRFRTFLLTALKRFLANEWDRARAQKRGGGASVIALDGLSPEARYALEPVDRLSADQLYERRWALTLLERVLERVRAECQASARPEVFEHLKDTLVSAGRRTPYAGLAERLGMSEGAVKVAVHRLRRRYRELLEEEIAATVTLPEEVAQERRHLLAILAR